MKYFSVIVIIFFHAISSIAYSLPSCYRPNNTITPSNASGTQVIDCIGIWNIDNMVAAPVGGTGNKQRCDRFIATMTTDGTFDIYDIKTGLNNTINVYSSGSTGYANTSQQAWTIGKTYIDNEEYIAFYIANTSGNINMTAYNLNAYFNSGFQAELQNQSSPTPTNLNATALALINIGCIPSSNQNEDCIVGVFGNASNFNGQLDYYVQYNPVYSAYAMSFNGGSSGQSASINLCSDNAAIMINVGGYGSCLSDGTFAAAIGINFLESCVPEMGNCGSQAANVIHVPIGKSGNQYQIENSGITPGNWVTWNPGNSNNTTFTTFVPQVQTINSTSQGVSHYVYLWNQSGSSNAGAWSPNNNPASYSSGGGYVWTYPSNTNSSINNSDLAKSQVCNLINCGIIIGPPPSINANNKTNLSVAEVTEGISYTTDQQQQYSYANTSGLTVGSLALCYAQTNASFNYGIQNDDASSNVMQSSTSYGINDNSCGIVIGQYPQFSLTIGERGSNTTTTLNYSGQSAVTILEVIPLIASGAGMTNASVLFDWSDPSNSAPSLKGFAPPNPFPTTVKTNPYSEYIEAITSLQGYISDSDGQPTGAVTVIGKGGTIYEDPNETSNTTTTFTSTTTSTQSSQQSVSINTTIGIAAFNVSSKFTTKWTTSTSISSSSSGLWTTNYGSNIDTSSSYTSCVPMVYYVNVVKCKEKNPTQPWFIPNLWWNNNQNFWILAYVNPQVENVVSSN